MFALLALAGDLGCFSGPQLVGLVSEAVPELGLRAGLLAAIVFPLGLTVAVGESLEKSVSPEKISKEVLQGGGDGSGSFPRMKLPGKK